MSTQLVNGKIKQSCRAATPANTTRLEARLPQPHRSCLPFWGACIHRGRRKRLGSTADPDCICIGHAGRTRSIDLRIPACGPCCTLDGARFLATHVTPPRDDCFGALW